MKHNFVYSNALRQQFTESRNKSSAHQLYQCSVLILRLNIRRHLICECREFCMEIIELHSINREMNKFLAYGNWSLKSSSGTNSFLNPFQLQCKQSKDDLHELNEFKYRQWITALIQLLNYYVYTQSECLTDISLWYKPLANHR